MRFGLLTQSSEISGGESEDIQEGMRYLGENPVSWLKVGHALGAPVVMNALQDAKGCCLGSSIWL